MKQTIDSSTFLSPFIHFCFAAILLLCTNMALAAQPLDINIATAEQFSAVMTGVGATKAQAIVEYREANGTFSRVDDLIFVKGIGPALLEKNRALLSVGEGEKFEPEIVDNEPL
ncbi:ComEA family DNA-binding protein [Marinomonas agarivorans]|nr:ComEA family DNA-binding protein [Marinomonas agarivorans]